MTPRIGRPHARFGIVLLLQFGLMFWLVAFDRGRDIRHLLDLTGVIIPLFAIGVATTRKRERRIAFALAMAAMAFSGSALSGFRPGNLDLGPLLAAAFSAYSTWVLLEGIVRSERVTGDVLAGALAAYITAGLAFAVVYGVIENYVPGAFETARALPASFPDLVYFSFVTLLTIGFGDVTPTAPLARAFVIFEGIFGVVFTTVVMASLVAGYLRHREQETTGPAS
jgi:voltage-gated potassium channel